MGEEFCQGSGRNDSIQQNESTDQLYARDPLHHFKISALCNDVMSQVQTLKSMEENLAALNRVVGGVQTLVARHVTLMLIASITVQNSSQLLSALKELGILDLRSLVRLLRLVDDGRINGTPSEMFIISTPSNLYPLPALQCLSDAISTVVTEGAPSAGMELMQSCSRDLLTAAVGGAELIRQAGRRLRKRWHSTGDDDDVDVSDDLSTLVSPNFKVSQRLVRILAKSSGKLVGTEEHLSGVVHMMDALAACLFSTKLEAKHRLWALQQLMKIFVATNGNGSVKKDKHYTGTYVCYVANCKV